MSAIADVLAQDASRRSAEEFEKSEKRKRKNYEHQLGVKNAAKAREQQARAKAHQDRHIEMRIKGGVQRVNEAAWEDFYKAKEVTPLLESLTRIVRAKLFTLRDETIAQIERMCGAQMRKAGLAKPEGMFEEIFEKNMMAHVELYAGRQGPIQAELDAIKARDLHKGIDQELKDAIFYYAKEYHEDEIVRVRDGAFTDLGALLHPLYTTVFKHPAVRAQDYFDDSWGEDEELKGAHWQTIIESFHHCLLDEMLQIFQKPNEAGENRRKKKVPSKPKERKLDDETRRRIDAMIFHHAPKARKLLDDYFGLLYKSTRKQFVHRKNHGDLFASTADPVKARRVRNLMFRKTLDPTRYYDSRWGMIDDEGAERIVLAAAAKPEYERLRDDLVVAVLDMPKDHDPDAKVVVRLLFHLASHDRSIVEMSWFEDSEGVPWGKTGAGEAQDEMRLAVATRTLREVALRVARECGYAEAGDGDKFRFGEPIAPEADDGEAPTKPVPTSQDLRLKDGIEAVYPETTEGASMWASDATVPEAVAKPVVEALAAPPPPPPEPKPQAVADAHHRAASVPKRLAAGEVTSSAPPRLSTPAPPPPPPPKKKKAPRAPPKPVWREPPAAVPLPLKIAAAAPTPTPECLEAVAAITTYAWDQSGNFVKIYVSLPSERGEPIVVSALFSAVGLAIRLEDGDGSVHELKFAALFRTLDPAKCRVVPKSGGRALVKLRKADVSVEWGCLLEAGGEEAVVESLDEVPEDPVKESMDEQNARIAGKRAAGNAAMGEAAASAGAELEGLIRAASAFAQIKQCIENAPERAIAGYRGRNEYTALHLAADERRPDVARLLLATGACDVDARDMRGHTPLHLAAAVAADTVVEALLEHGADGELTDSLGRAPLHLACMLPNGAGGAVVDVLLSFGVDAVQRTSEGHRPIDLANHFENLGRIEAALIAHSPPGWDAPPSDANAAAPES